MIQRCKNCGEWVEAEEREALDRAINPICENLESEGGFFEETGSLFGLKGLGRAIDRMSRLPFDVVRGATESVLGDKYHFHCDNCDNEWSTDNESEDETEYYVEVLKQCNLVKGYIDKSIKLIKAPWNERVRFVNELSASLPSISIIDLRTALFDTLAFSQFKLLGNTNEALNAISESLKLKESFKLKDNPSTHALHGVILGEGRTPNDKYKALQELIYCKDLENEAPLFFTKQEYLKKLEEQNLHYAEHFLDIPQNQRKFLVIDNELHYLPDSFKVLTINSIPTEIQFPVGHPIEKQMYICHPLKPNMYLPVEDYQLELFRDEVKELCILLQTLGAKKLIITDSRSNEKSAKIGDELGGEFGGGVKSNEAKVNGRFYSDNEEYLKIKNEFIRNQEFTKSSILPCVPEGLIWYSHRADWQQMALQRTQGTLVHHHDYLSVQKNTLINENEKKQLEADYKNLMVKCNVKMDTNKSRLFKESSNYTFELNVDFYPLSAYKKISNISINEQLGSNTKNIYKIIAFVLLLGVILSLVFLI